MLSDPDTADIRAGVLETGCVALEGPSAQVAANPKVKEAYLGE